MEEIKIDMTLTKFEVEIVNEDTKAHIDLDVYEVTSWSSDGTIDSSEPYLKASIDKTGRYEIKFSSTLFGRRELDQHILLLNQLWSLAEEKITEWDNHSGWRLDKENEHNKKILKAKGAEKFNRQAPYIYYNDYINRTKPEVIGNIHDTQINAFNTLNLTQPHSTTKK